MSQATILSGMQTAAAMPLEPNSAPNSAALASPMDQGFGDELSLALESLAEAQTSAVGLDAASDAQALAGDAGLQNMPLAAPWLPLVAANFSSAAQGMPAPDAAADGGAALQRAGQALPTVQAPLPTLAGAPQLPATPNLMGAGGPAAQGLAAQAQTLGQTLHKAGSPADAAGVASAGQAAAAWDAPQHLVTSTPSPASSSTQGGLTPQEPAAGALNTAPQSAPMPALTGAPTGTPATSPGAASAGPTASASLSVAAQAGASLASAPVGASDASGASDTSARQTPLKPAGAGMPAVNVGAGSDTTADASADAPMNANAGATPEAHTAATAAGGAGATAGLQPSSGPRAEPGSPPASLRAQATARSASEPTGLAPGVPHSDPATPSPATGASLTTGLAAGDAPMTVTANPHNEPAAAQASAAQTGRRSARQAAAAGEGPLDFTMQSGAAQPLRAGMAMAGPVAINPAQAPNALAAQAPAGFAATALGGAQTSAQTGAQASTQGATQRFDQTGAQTVSPTATQTAHQTSVPASLEAVQPAQASPAQDGAAQWQTASSPAPEPRADSGAAPSLWSSSFSPALSANTAATAAVQANTAAAAVDVSLPIKPHWVSLDGGAVQVEVLRMAREGGGRVTLELTPPDQGSYRLDLRIDEAGQATLVVEGVSESMRTRLEMGEAALREQFNQMGLQLNLQMRGQHQLAERGGDGQPPSQAGPSSGTAAGEEGAAARRPVALDLERGLVRLYA